MRELERRVRRDFDRIADQAPVSSESWELLRRRIAAEPDRTDEEVIMLAPAEPTSTRPRWTTAVAFAAVAALAIAGGIALWANNDDGTDTLTTDDDTDVLTADDGPATVAAAFDPAVDDLCDWVTGDDIVAHLSVAGDDVEGPATPIGPNTEDSTGWACAWVLASGEEIQLGARTTTPRTQTEPVEPGGSGAGFVEYEELGQIMAPGAYVIGHPDLGEGITVENQAFLRFSFYPLGSDHILNVNYLSDDAMCADSELDDSGFCDKNTSGYETVVMRAADAILQDIGWTEPTTPVEEDSTPVTDVDWQYGSSLPGELEQVVAWSDGLAAIMDVDGDETPAGGEVWYSTDGIEWSGGASTLRNDTFGLAGGNGDLFALTGDPDDAETPQTLWHRRAGEPWSTVITSEALDHMAVGPDRLIAYGRGGFNIVGVFDTATISSVEFAALPEIDFGPTDTDAATGAPFAPTVELGQAIALDDGFLAEVDWITGVDDGEAVREWRLMYSADGSAWVEHPNPPHGATLPYWDTSTIPLWGSSAPAFDGINLLSPAGNGAFKPWITDDGLSLSAATDPGRHLTATDDGFFTVDDRNRIHRSIDGITWDLLQPPPTWPRAHLFASEAGDVQYGSIFTHDDQLLAIGTRGDFEGWVGIVNPTTEIWIADR